MLNSETKRHIDAARQVLVGVVPNPASQIDQITNALLYKFMDDMDQKSVEAGDKASFFTGNLEQYAWSRLMDTKIGNQKKMQLYSDALIKFSESDQLPQLFRDIFKDAILPYRSPETLGLFLQEIDYFDYSHSEELGNAYEYLLSIMSSQGDAGQFRTPRHIIDFIVDVVNPTKDDKILDPACGTSGFLVSSYKHILEQHDEHDNKGKKKPLTPDQRKKMASNFAGYDIDPGMVRIAQVNMFLHQFKNPKIYQYDTLSSEDHWGDKFNVILANPPFMSPKGGIRPHSKFGIQSTRSEVLFVDYIMSHLYPKGRAGIIVPEGIIFQAGTAYKQLRKSLVGDGLYAVVSLPTGVFQPYSGVKTSILLLDSEIAKQRSEILFVKIKNDGFSLGATRREIDKNDLHDALDILNKWRAGEEVEGNLVVRAEKTKIAENGEYNLTGERYRAEIDYSNARWQMVRLGEVCEITMGQSPSSEFYNNNEKGLEFHQGKTNFTNLYIKHSKVWASQYNKVAEKKSILMSVRAPVGPVNITQRKIALGRGLCGIISNDDCDQMYLFYILQSSKGKLTQSSHGSTFDSINRDQLLEFEIPLPPLETQKKIASEIDQYQKVIMGCRQIVDNYKPTIDVDPSWETVELGEIYQNITDTISPEMINPISHKYIGLEHIKAGAGLFVKDFDGIIEDIKSNKSKFKAGDILYGKLRPNLNKVVLVDFDGICSTDILVLRGVKNSMPVFYHALFLSKSFNDEVMRGISGTRLPRTKFDHIKTIKIPRPPYEVQKSIVANINNEKKIVEGNNQLIEIYTQKIQDRVSKIWNK